MPTIRFLLLLLAAIALHAAAVAADTITLAPGDDDATAITNALVQLKAGGVLTLSAGHFHLSVSSTAPAAVFGHDLANVTIVGDGAILVGTGAERLLGFDHCQHLTLRHLHITWDPLPYTVGTVTAQDAEFHGVDLAIAAPFRAEAGRLTKAVMGWDPVHDRCAADGWEVYQCNGERAEMSTITAAGAMRIPIQNHASLPATGAAVVVRHEVYAGGAIGLHACSDVTIDDVAIDTTPGMGLIAWECRDLTVRHLTVAPPPGLVMSSTADAMHFGACRGNITIADSHFAGMGDDALNIHGVYGLVVARPDDHTVVVQGARLNPYYDKARSAWTLPLAGDAIEACAVDAPLLPTLQFTVAEAHIDGARTVISSTEALPAAITVDSLLANTATLPVVRVARCQVRGNRARGFLLQSRDVVVADCTFTDISGAAIQICCDDAQWCEGPGARDVRIHGCYFADCNFGIARRGAILDLFADLAGNHPAPAGVHRFIGIDHCIFAGIGTSIHIGSADDVHVGLNTYADGIAVAIDHSRHVDIVAPAGNMPKVSIGDDCPDGAVTFSTP